MARGGVDGLAGFERQDFHLGRYAEGTECVVSRGGDNAGHGGPVGIRAPAFPREIQHLDPLGLLRVIQVRMFCGDTRVDDSNRFPFAVRSRMQRKGAGVPRTVGELCKGVRISWTCRSFKDVFTGDSRNSGVERQSCQGLHNRLYAKIDRQRITGAGKRALADERQTVVGANLARVTGNQGDDEIGDVCRGQAR